ncbi:DAZ-associated protein 1-like isoform X2 [Anneissia japonica]|uniref:DAZ-associated protein 1-like isoform X2 n=1 Tax=Anneissia japonica TaxID=1529436 RepID=UPI0014256049|nr:DAZ-associated protein 1-like isoform X2 [Anneissia japonica]
MNVVLNKSMASDDEVGKVFVGGISWETTKESIRAYFSKYGELSDCVLMHDRVNGRSRGFGFVRYKDASIVDKVLADGPHILDGKKIDPKPCTPRSQSKRASSAIHNKVFVGGLSNDTTEADLHSIFSTYGSVIEVVIMTDQQTKRSRGFGFVTFDNEDTVNRLDSVHFLEIKGKRVEVKKAQPRFHGGDKPDGGSHHMGGGGGAMRHQGGFNQPNMWNQNPGPQGFNQNQNFGGYGGQQQGGWSQPPQQQQGQWGQPSMNSYGQQNYGGPPPGQGGPGGPHGGGGQPGGNYGGGYNNSTPPNYMNQQTQGRQYPMQGGQFGQSPQTQQPNYDLSPPMKNLRGLHSEAQRELGQPQQQYNTYGGNYGAQPSNDMYGNQNPAGYGNPQTYGSPAPQKDTPTPTGDFNNYQNPTNPPYGSMGNYAQEASGYGPQRVNYNQHGNFNQPPAAGGGPPGNYGQDMSNNYQAGPPQGGQGGGYSGPPDGQELYNPGQPSGGFGRPAAAAVQQFHPYKR